MPELAEVETVRRVLKEKIIGLKIRDVISNYPKMVELDFKSFKEELINKEFKDILRYGKYLVFKLEDIYLISHLRMEGKFFYVEDNYEENKHIHMVFKLSNGYKLLYMDTRKFGRMTLRDEKTLYVSPPISMLAPDANKISFEELKANLENRRGPIKSILLDQSVIAGLGNIYVDEVLAYSHISPLRNANELNDNEIKNIIEGSKAILDKAILYKGTTIKSYTSSLNVYGMYQNYLIAHTMSKCHYCNKDIQIIKVGGRSTYYCKECQK